MSLFGRVASFFRADAAPVAPAQAQPTTRRDSSRGGFGAAGGYSNPITGLGMPGTDSRSASQYHAGYMTDELAVEMWRGDMLAGKIVSLLPKEAAEPGVALTIQDEKKTVTGAEDTRPAGDLVEDVERCHRDLNTEAMIVKACEWERLFGGAAIWAGANDYQAGSFAQPLNLEAKALSIRWLDVVRSRDLTPVRRYTDPLHPKFGQVEIWHLSRTIGGGTMQQQADIHESRLFLFRGRRIVDDGTVITQNLQSTEFGDGILLAVQGALRRFQEALDNTELAMRANGELLWQHNRLSEILGNEGEDDFRKLVSAMNYAASILRARVVGADQTLTRQSISLAGLADIVTKFENELAAISDTPRTKLFGDVPGGLGNNATGPHGDWDETKGVYRKRSQFPAYEWVTKLIFRSLGGEPRRWKLEGKPYRHPTEQEQGAIVKGEADTDIALAGAGIITAEEVRARPIWRDRYSLPDPAEETAAPALGEVPDDIRDPAGGALPPGAEAPVDPAAAAAPEGPKLAELALNGAQALALKATVESVAAGTIPRESGAELVQFSFKVPADQAERMMPKVGFKPSAVDGGLQAAPGAAPAATPALDSAPRRDATRTMAALLAELAPDGICDDCGQSHPLEVDHIEGRGWNPASLSKAQRAARYWQEYDDGVPLRALCRSCNARDGAKNKQGKSGPRHRADAISLGGNVRFTYAPLPDELVAAMRALRDEVVPDDGIPQEIDHLTLVYCGKAEEDLDEEEIEEVVDELAGVAAATPPIRAKVQGWAYFDGARKDGQPMTALVALVDAPGITELQVELREALADAGMEPSAEHSFSPHFTFCYLPPGGRVEGLPAISAEFTIDRVCFANREVHELQLGSVDVDLEEDDEETDEHEENETADDNDPAAIVDRITPYQQRALKGEDRTALVATIELLMGVPPAMAERLIPGGSPAPPTPPAPPAGTTPPSSTRGDGADCAPADDEEDREDCKNPIRGEGGRFAGCAPGEGSESGALHERGPRGGAKGEGAPAASRPARTRRAPSKPAPAKEPTKKPTPKQKERAVAKAAREKEKARKAKIKERAKAKREKERARKVAAKEKAANAKAVKAAKAAEKTAAKAKATGEKAATAAAAKPPKVKPAAKPAPPQARPESTATPTGKAFSELAVRAATSVPQGKNYGQKVYVSEAFKEAQKESPGLTLPQFKRELVQANQRGELLLARADFPALMDKAAVASSEIADNGQSFHFIVPPQPKRNRETNR